MLFYTRQVWLNGFRTVECVCVCACIFLLVLSGSQHDLRV